MARGLWLGRGDQYEIVHHMEHQPEPDVLAQRRQATPSGQRRKRRKAVGLPLGDDDVTA